ncbi:kinase-like domain-containing protein [Suillus occidentalis]|nr:kinase-like domain-containing protein [Suillus occidentalis]
MFKRLWQHALQRFLRHRITLISQVFLGHLATGSDVFRQWMSSLDIIWSHHCAVDVVTLEIRSSHCSLLLFILTSAIYNAPDAMSIDMNASTADFGSDLPDLLYPTDSELASRAAKTRVATFEHSGVAEAPQNSPVPIFRVFQTSGKGGFARAVLAQSSMEPSRVFYLKVFQKDRLRDIEEILMDELAVNKRIAAVLPCPARNFLMGLEFSLQTKNEIIFAMDLMADDLSMYMIDRPAYCLKHSHRWTSQIALGIYTLHAMGIIHRDIKPENILIDVQENIRLADYSLCYVDEHENPLYREQVYSTSAVGTTYCMAPEVVRNVLRADSMEYGTPLDWWSLGCVMVQLFSRNHEAAFGTKDDILWYVYWCSSRDRLDRRRVLHDQDFHPDIADLLSGLLDPIASTRYGMPQIVCNEAFTCVSGNGNTLFTKAYTQAEEREELPDSLPKLQDDDPSEEWLGLLPSDAGHIPNVDWVKPNYDE